MVESQANTVVLLLIVRRPKSQVTPSRGSNETATFRRALREIRQSISWGNNLVPAWLSLKEYCKEVTGSAIGVGINTLHLCSMKTKGVIEKNSHCLVDGILLVDCLGFISEQCSSCQCKEEYVNL